MYLAFFGFREKPFNLTPDPKFLYLNASYREALAALHYGIAERKGFVTLIGEAGTGKTTLLRRLLSELGLETRSVLVLNPSVSFDDLLAFILTDLGRPPAPATPKLEMLEALNAELLDTLARGGNVVVLIDEAQDLGTGVLEELRLLSNLETAKEKILQFVLAGQPELDAILERRELRQLRQRIAVFARLRPLVRRELEAYVRARIEAAGGSAVDLFSRPALYRLWRFSGGVPRLVNVAGDNALVTAYAAGRRGVGWRAVGEAVADLRPSRSSTKRTPRRLSLAAVGVVAVLGIALGIVGSRLGSDVITRRAGEPREPSVDLPMRAPTAHEKTAGEAPAGPASGQAQDPVQIERPNTDVPADGATSDHAAVTSPLDARIDTPRDVGRGEIAAATVPPEAHSPRDAQAPADLADGDHATADAQPLDAHPAGTDATIAAEDRQLLPVRIESGDTLTHIVRRYYGHESPALLTAVLRANPSIGDPNVVLIGQTVLLPGIATGADRDNQPAGAALPAESSRDTKRRP